MCVSAIRKKDMNFQKAWMKRLQNFFGILISFRIDYLAFWFAKVRRDKPPFLTDYPGWISERE